MSDAVSTGSMSSSQLQSSMNQLNDQQNANEFNLYSQAAAQSFNNSMAQTLGGLATDAAKAKPQV